MPDSIQFVRHVQKSRLHNPLMEGKLDTQEIEIRRDPLTGAQSVFNPRLEDKVAMFFGESDPALIEKLAKESEPRCFLCGDRWQEMTPTYNDAELPEGRIQVGEAVLFPNLFPAAQVHAVIRVGDRHYVPLAEFEAAPVVEALQASLQFARSIGERDRSVEYLTTNANYLGPAGASIAHPHFQVMGGDLPFSYMETVFLAARRHFEANGSCYWTDLVELEKRTGERYIGATGPVEWIASFSPRGTNEVIGVLPRRTSFLEMDDADAAGLGQGLVDVLHAYADMGVSTFNFAVYSGPLHERDDALRCFVRVISRQNLYENYRTDDFFLQKLLRNELILTTPEVLAETVRSRMDRRPA